MFINGSWPAADSTFDVLNPADGSVFAQVADATVDDAQKAIEAAAAASEAWAATPHPQRAKALLDVADVLEKRQQDIAGILVGESGSWIGKAMFETGYAPGIYRAAAAAAYQVTGEILPSDHSKVSMVVRQPLGVVSVISPWNFPLLLSSRGIAVAIAVGNAVVLKPSEETPVAGGLFLAEVFEEAGVPEGVLNVITCSRKKVTDVGGEMVSNPLVKAISFTGSTAVGRHIGAQAGSLLKKACLELGGKDALIVLDDADMTRAVNAATFGSFMHQGQICMATEKLVVHESVAAEFTEKLVANVKTLGVGDPTQMGNVIGPIINQKQLDKIHAQVEDAREKGADVLTGGTYDGLFYQPTVISKVTRDIEIARRLETGMAHVNDSSVNDEPHVPFGGVKNSGLGRHGGKAAIDAFTETRWLTLERGGRHYPPPFVVKD
jgi:aldehyde dehydrogenase (NAD+)